MAQLMPESCCASIIIMAMINGFLNELFTNISFNVTCNHCVKNTGVRLAEEKLEELGKPLGQASSTPVLASSRPSRRELRLFPSATEELQVGACHCL